MDWKNVKLSIQFSTLLKQFWVVAKQIFLSFNGH